MRRAAVRAMGRLMQEMGKGFVKDGKGWKPDFSVRCFWFRHFGLTFELFTCDFQLLRMIPRGKPLEHSLNLQ